MLTDLPFCLQKMRIILYLSIFASIGQVRVQDDDAKISLYHAVIFRKKVILVLITKQKNTWAQIVI